LGLRPPDIVLLSADRHTRAPLRAQLIEDGFEVVATDTWPMMREQLRPGSKPRLAIVDRMSAKFCSAKDRCRVAEAILTGGAGKFVQGLTQCDVASITLSIQNGVVNCLGGAATRIIVGLGH